MKTLFVLVGIQGAGKSTVLEALVNKGFTILKPSTTRSQRNSSDTEYHFVTDRDWGNETYAWEISIVYEKIDIISCIVTYDNISRKNRVFKK